ncbi:MAG: PhzF family phenazine biosynthesis protein [Bdellovibrionia bacterium]
MTQLSFLWIDAFTSTKFGGNPCAVVLDTDHLSAEQMQRIAKEINLSETAFVRSSTKADFGARYFTPEEELPFAGHPTIATIHSLIHTGRINSPSAKGSVSLEVPAGIIPVEYEVKADRTRITMSQLAPRFLRTYESTELLEIFGLNPSDLLPGARIQTVSTGTPILMVPLASLDALRRARYVDPEKYLKLKSEGDFLFAHHFCLEGATPKGRTFARSLPTPPATLEDPYTGSATGCMAAYLWKYGFVQEDRLIAEQGHWMGRPGVGELERVGSADNIQAIRLSGEAVTLIEGKISP